MATTHAAYGTQHTATSSSKRDSWWRQNSGKFPHFYLAHSHQKQLAVPDTTTTVGFRPRSARFLQPPTRCLRKRRPRQYGKPLSPLSMAGYQAWAQQQSFSPVRGGAPVGMRSLCKHAHYAANPALLLLTLFYHTLQLIWSRSGCSLVHRARRYGVSWKRCEMGTQGCCSIPFLAYTHQPIHLTVCSGIQHYCQGRLWLPVQGLVCRVAASSYVHNSTLGHLQQSLRSLAYIQ